MSTKTVTISIRLTKQEYDRLYQACALIGYGVTPTGFVHAIVVAETNKILEGGE